MVIPAQHALRFLLELAGLAAAAWTGFSAADGPLGWLLAVAAPLALAVFWAFVAAPRATNGLTPGLRTALGSAALLCTAAGLAGTGQVAAAAAFAALIVLNNLLLALPLTAAAGEAQ